MVRFPPDRVENNTCISYSRGQKMKKLPERKDLNRQLGTHWTEAALEKDETARIWTYFCGQACIPWAKSYFVFFLLIVGFIIVTAEANILKPYCEDSWGVLTAQPRYNAASLWAILLALFNVVRSKIYHSHYYWEDWKLCVWALGLEPINSALLWPAVYLPEPFFSVTTACRKSSIS